MKEYKILDRVYYKDVGYGYIVGIYGVADPIDKRRVEIMFDLGDINSRIVRKMTDENIMTASEGKNYEG